MASGALTGLVVEGRGGFVEIPPNNEGVWWVGGEVVPELLRGSVST